MTGTDLVHIPYKGGAPAVAAVVANEVPLSFAAINSPIPFIQAGRVRAVATSESEPFAQLGLPTIGASVKGYDVGIWYGVMAPAGTPKSIIDKLNAELAAIVQIAGRTDFGHVLSSHVRSPRVLHRVYRGEGRDTQSPCGPSFAISAASCSTSFDLRSVNGGRTGPALRPTMVGAGLDDAHRVARARGCGAPGTA